MADEDWNKLYSEVVWAKFGSFPWWPSFIYDPEKLPTTCAKQVRDKAGKLYKKQYVIYFYADGTFGFVGPKAVRPFNEETTSQFKEQKVAKGYQESYAKAIALADEQLRLPASERVSWHYSTSSSADSEEEQGDAGLTEGKKDVKDKADKAKQKKTAPKKKFKDSKPEKAEEPSDLYFADNSELTAEAAEEEEEEEEEEDEEEEGDEEVSIAEEEADEEEESAGSEYEQGNAAVGGKTLRRSAAGSQSNKKRPRADRSSATAHRKRSTAQAQEEAEDDEVVIKGRTSASKPRPSGGGFEDESLLDRLTRFAGILRVCGAEGGDVARVVKVLDKLVQLTVTGAELVKSGVGKAATDLRRHSDAQISSRAAALRAQWKAVMVQEQEAAKTPTAIMVTPVASSAPESAASRTPLAAPRGVGPSTQSEGTAGKSHPARARAVRLLREAVTAGRAATGAGDGDSAGQQCASSSSSAVSSAGEVAFAVERAAMDCWGVGHPRYFECVTRLAAQFKAGAEVEAILQRLPDGGIVKCLDLISPS